MRHLDLFSGIGGFSLAADRVFGEVEHIFVEIDPFCQAVLKKHWPNSKIYGDIRQFIANTERLRQLQSEGREQKKRKRTSDGITLLTGGFPCQPFSAAGRRRGTEDDRYLWPAMFDVVKITRPRWVVAENVRGLITWNDGMVLETVCADLEGEGYEVQPFVIPACAVGAPHRRDRIWIVAHSTSERQCTGRCDREGRQVLYDEKRSSKKSEPKRYGRERRSREAGENVENSIGERGRGRGKNAGQILAGKGSKIQDAGSGREAWSRDWREVAFATCDDGMDDGLPRGVGGLPHSFAKWRKEALKAYGNAIVPQVATEIFRAIRATM